MCFCKSILVPNLHTGSVKRHVENIHEGIKRFKCGNCEAAYADIRLLKRHKVKVHKSQSELSCKECKLFFSSEKGLNAHQNVYHGNGENLVQIKKSTTKLHRKVQKPTIDTVSEEELLKKHVTIHEGLKDNSSSKQKQFECNDCHKIYKAKMKVIDHINKVHRGLKNHECAKCKKVFGYQENLKKHHDSAHKPLNMEN